MLGGREGGAEGGARAGKAGRAGRTELEEAEGIVAQPMWREKGGRKEETRK